MPKKVDLRILKTRKAIKESFFKLIKEKGYERITIQDIAEEAMINRNTFYLHYLDKPDLMEKIAQEYLDRFDESLKTEIHDVEAFTKSDFIIILETMFQNIAVDFEFYQIMIEENGQLSFSSNLKGILKNHILAGIKDSTLANNFQIIYKKKIEVALEYMVSGIVGVICLWIHHPEKYSIPETVQLLSDIHFRNIKDLLDHKQ